MTSKKAFFNKQKISHKNVVSTNKDKEYGMPSKKKNCRFKDKVPIGFNSPPLKHD